MHENKIKKSDPEKKLRRVLAASTLAGDNVRNSAREDVFRSGLRSPLGRGPSLRRRPVDSLREERSRGPRRRLVVSTRARRSRGRRPDDTRHRACRRSARRRRRAGPIGHSSRRRRRRDRTRRERAGESRTTPGRARRLGYLNGLRAVKLERDDRFIEAAPMLMLSSDSRRMKERSVARA